jgi:hypothetical protein
MEKLSKEWLRQKADGPNALELSEQQTRFVHPSLQSPVGIRESRWLIQIRWAFLVSWTSGKGQSPNLLQYKDEHH